MIKPKKKYCSGCGDQRYIYRRIGRDGYCTNCWKKEMRKGGKPTDAFSSSKKRKPIARRSDKRARQDIAYSALRKSFLDVHPSCMLNIPGVCSGKRSNQVHHSFSGKDRDKYYLDTTTWFATEDNCHRWVHENPKEARELGFLK